MALKRGIVELEDYNLKWNEDYEKEKKLLEEVLGNLIVEINHVGSTSIKGLKAKPIIDISLVINSLDEVPKIDELLTPYGYHNRGNQGIEDRIFFAKGPDDARTHYLHITTPNSNTLKGI